jgi:hypothetical protein
MGSEGLVRQLTVGVPGNNYPNTFAVQMIAQEFGFTGWDGKADIEVLLENGTWMAKVIPEQGCVMVVQVVEGELS